MGARMGCYNGLRKGIALAIIITFLFQVDVFLYTQRGDDIEAQFRKIKESYLKEQQVGAQKRIERLMVFIDEKKLGMQKILGMCHLLLGAIYERSGKLELAKENYRKAKEDYDTTKVDGVNLDSLELYLKIVIKPPPPVVDGVIAKLGKKKKKKFPWLLVAGGIVIVTVVLFLLLKKKKKKTYTLTVAKGDGVDGNPGTGSYIYNNGREVNYSYSPQSGYVDLEITLDGNVVNYTGSETVSGTIEMDGDHTLIVSTRAETALTFITDTKEINIDEGDTATFNVRLSDAPTGEIYAEVGVVEGDNDIEILVGKLLEFTPDNWDEYQEVTLKANFDGDDSNDKSIIEIDALGVIEAQVIVWEEDKFSGDDYPEIKIKNPPDGETVSSVVKIEVEATDDKGIDRVEFFIDGEPKSTAQSFPYTYMWATTDSPDKDVVIRAVVYDTIGQSDDDSVTVTVENDKPPTVSIVSPSNGETVSGTITIRVDASDDVRITKVELYVGDDFVDSDGTQPYSFGLDTNALPNGSHFIKVYAYDTAGQTATAEIVLNVDNRGESRAGRR